MCPRLDRPSKKVMSPLKSATIIQSFLNNYGICDAFHFQNLRQGNFQVHQSYSRIDNIFLDNKLLPYLQDCSYESKVVSDHAPVVLGLNFAKAPPKNHQWSFNTDSLKDKDFVKFISSNISSFLEINSTPGMAYSSIWETLKCYLRGLIISYSSYKNRERKKQLEEWSGSITAIDTEYSLNPSPNLYKERQILQTKYDLLSTEEAKTCFYVLNIRSMNSVIYEFTLDTPA